ncbi:MAG: hypothetical protein IT305_11780 [Chloroflexi bacterium]|nr:hypothetical protein [Chloroflexota bacterium]
MRWLLALALLSAVAPVPPSRGLALAAGDGTPPGANASPEMPDASGESSPPVCTLQTPLPSELALVPPPPGLPAETAAFYGAWEGTVQMPDGPLDVRIVVRRLAATEAFVIDSYQLRSRPDEGRWGTYRADVDGGRLTYGDATLQVTLTMSPDLATVSAGRTSSSGVATTALSRCAL